MTLSSKLSKDVPQRLFFLVTNLFDYSLFLHISATVQHPNTLHFFKLRSKYNNASGGKIMMMHIMVLASFGICVSMLFCSVGSQSLLVR